jgi:hypothetical protein
VSFYSTIIDKLRGINNSSLNTKLYSYGAIYSGSYLRFKKDPNPTILCLYSDNLHTHGINLHYLDSFDQQKFMRLIYMIYRSNQQIDGKALYQYFKYHGFQRVIDKSYRIYMTSLAKYKLVSPGFSPLPLNMCYPSNENFIKAFNRQYNNEEIEYKNENRVEYTTNELQSMVANSLNTIHLNFRR